ncbi:guanylate kinase [Candidatus Binatus sp.]|uniref:guanylate kinase n=1 Tax=Candidatus Binatus sp. TaxID=2811406 RepID=UPI002FDA4234
MPPRRGIIFILSAPSGAGKTTIWRASLKAIAGLEFSVSLTTRAPRAGEADGIDYSFVSEEEFKRRQSSGELAEWARVFESSYGTPRAPLDAAIASGRDILLDIDIQGARQIRAMYLGDAVAIFVLPPTFAELEGRLRGRGTEEESKIQHRLRKARDEAQAYPEYDYLIVNAQLRESVARLETIVNAERLKVGRLRGEFGPWKS